MLGRKRTIPKSQQMKRVALRKLRKQLKKKAKRQLSLRKLKSQKDLSKLIQLQKKKRSRIKKMRQLPNNLVHQDSIRLT
jgi:hypothetical protein